jgi:cell division protein FtsN
MHSPIPYQAEGRSMARQAGGTVAGLIIGLIIGLTIAVWVAITIMKTPLPFVDKLGKQNDAADTAIDPNATLPGGARDRRLLPNAEEGAPLADQKQLQAQHQPVRAQKKKVVTICKRVRLEKWQMQMQQRVGLHY